MKNTLQTLTITAIIGFLPAMALADSITLQTVLPAVDEDITPPDNQKAAEENFYTFWFKGQIGTQYGASFTVSEEPAFTFVSGGSMTVDNNVHYNPETQTFSVEYTAEPLEQIDAQSGLELEDNQTLTIIAISFPVEEGENGPGEATIGSWIATNFQEWTLTTPSAENNMMGATVSGDAGDSGQFKMFMPQVALDTMTEYDGEEAGDYTADDFATYEDAVLVNEDVTSVDGGALLNFTTTLPEETSSDNTDEDTQTIQSGPGVSQTITVGPREAVSLRANKTAVARGGRVKLTGWLKTQASGQRVILQSRTRGTAFKRIDSVRTTAGGKFIFRVQVRKQTAFRAKFDGDTSAAVQVQIE